MKIIRAAPCAIFVSLAFAMTAHADCPAPLSTLACKDKSCAALALESWGFASQNDGIELYGLDGRATRWGMLLYQIVSSNPQSLASMTQEQFEDILEDFGVVKFDENAAQALRKKSRFSADLSTKEKEAAQYRGEEPCQAYLQTPEPGEPAGFSVSANLSRRQTTRGLLRQYSKELSHQDPQKLSAEDREMALVLRDLLSRDQTKIPMQFQQLPVLLKRLGLRQQMSAAIDSDKPLENLSAPQPQRAQSVAFRNIVDRFPMGEPLVRLGAPAIEDQYHLKGKGVKALFIDQGLDPSSPYLGNRVAAVHKLWPANPKDEDPRHGTAVAAAYHALLPKSEILSAEIGDTPPPDLEKKLQQGRISQEDVQKDLNQQWLDALNWAQKEHVDIVSISVNPPVESWATDQYLSPFWSKINQLAAQGTVVIVAIGNSANNQEPTTEMLSRATSAVAVGAANSLRKPADASSYGAGQGGKKIPQIFAPGVAILVPCTDKKSGLCRESGNSFSAPMASAEAGFLIEASREWGVPLNASAVAREMAESAIPMAKSARNPGAAGYVSIRRALNDLQRQASQKPNS